MKVVEVLEATIKSVVKDVYGVELGAVFLEHPDNEKWGDYATNVSMELAKLVKQNPEEIAKKLSYELEKKSMTFSASDKASPFLEKIEIAPRGFINFRLSKEWLYYVLSQIQELSMGYGSQDLGHKTRVALEHSNVNPNKATHIGHLRNACIGQFLEKIYEFLGYNVEVQYYANNLGVQVATSAMGTEKIKDILPGNYEKFDHYAWDVYSKMEALIAENPELKKERDDLMTRLEDPKSVESIKQKELASKILRAQLKTFQNLGFDYDVIIHESDIISLKMWEKAFEFLKTNKNVYLAKEGTSKGCWLVKLSEGSNSEKSPAGIEEDKIIVRSNKVPTYTGKDIAYHMWKFGLLDVDFGYEILAYDTQIKPLWGTTSNTKSSKNISFSNAKKVLDVIGGEQTYAMDVVKKALSFLGYEEHSQNMTHINYGFVYLSPQTAQNLGIDVSDGKEKYGMSGRKGWGIKIDDFIEILDKKLVEEHGDFEALRDVRNGAIKFEMLKFNTYQDLVFDLDSSLNIKGFSGPYIQYTHARASSVLEKSDLSAYTSDKANMIPSSSEMSMLRYLYRFPEVVERAALGFAPNLMCNYLYELASRFNTFYNQASILNAESKELRDFRLLITLCTKTVLSNGLSLLGINAPSRM